MCVLFVARDVHPRYPLLVASNRDEAHDRPTAPAALWTACPRVLAGRDLQAGGTWHGVTTGGRWGIVTNLRAPEWMHRQAPRSRGALVADYLCGDAAPAAFAARAAADRAAYGGFNLLVGTPSALHYASSHAATARALGTGFYGLSNGALDEPWPKVQRGGQAFEHWVERGASDDEALFALMRDETPCPGRGAPADRRRARAGADPLPALHRRHELRHTRDDPAEGPRRRVRPARRALLRAGRCAGRHRNPRASPDLTRSLGGRSAPHPAGEAGRFLLGRLDRLRLVRQREPSTRGLGVSLREVERLGRHNGFEVLDPLGEARARSASDASRRCFSSSSAVQLGPPFELPRDICTMAHAMMATMATAKGFIARGELHVTNGEWVP